MRRIATRRLLNRTTGFCAQDARWLTFAFGTIPVRSALFYHWNDRAPEGAVNDPPPRTANAGAGEHYNFFAERERSRSNSDTMAAIRTALPWQLEILHGPPLRLFETQTSSGSIGESDG